MTERERTTAPSATDTVLVTIRRLALRGSTATRDAILERVAARQIDGHTLDAVLDDVVARGDVTRSDTAYRLTAAGGHAAKQATASFFDEWMIAAERSAAYRAFCQQVYGADRCQFDMLTQPQFARLLRVLRVAPGHHVLDLGCGTGAVTEDLAHQTGGIVLGVDFAPDAIAFAQEKARAQGDRLAFQVMDMDALTLPPERFDRVVSIDTLYFVTDLPKTVAALKESLKPDGAMGLFYSAQLFADQADQSPELLAPTTTKLAKALTGEGLTFETWEFTAEEQQLWEKKLEVAHALKDAFEAEGNLSLYKGRISEAAVALAQCNAGRKRRYLYGVRR